MADETPEVRPRRAGKSARRIAKIADAIGLKPDTVKDLIDAGWTLTFQSGEPSRWVQGAHHRNDALARGGMLPRGTVTMVGDGGGCVVIDRIDRIDGPGFGPGPSLGAGAIQIHGIGNPTAIAHQVSDALAADIRRLRGHQADRMQR